LTRILLPLLLLLPHPFWMHFWMQQSQWRQALLLLEGSVLSY
jgi:hypothetical protein